MSETIHVSAVTFLAGQAIGTLLVYSADAYREAADQPRLNPAYRETLLALAAFRAKLAELLEEPGRATPAPPNECPGAF